MLRLSFVLSAGLSLACGAKSELADFEPQSNVPPPVDAPNPVHPEGCTPGLQPGAPAPIHGYCSDRAGRAEHVLPQAPSLLASLATGSVIGGEPRVDAEGRAYFAIDTDDTDSAVIEKHLIAVDPDGTLAWTLPFEGRIGSFAIVADGTLRVVDTVGAAGTVQRFVSRVTPGGKNQDRRQLPESAGVAFAVTAEGNLIFTPTGNENAGRVVATTSRGELVWRSEPLAGYAEPAAIAPDGRVIVTASRSKQTEVVALDAATGARIWRFADAGHGGPPAIAPDGSIRFPLGSADLSTQELVALELDGSVRFRALLPGPAVTVGEPTCVDSLGASFVRTGNEVIGVDDHGNLRFAHSVHPNGTFGCAVDHAGHVLVASLGIWALDPESGKVLWQIDDGFPGNNAIHYAGPVVLAGDRRLVLMDHGGAVHFIGD